MPDRLSELPDDLSVLATRAADWFQREQGRSVPTAYVVKDFWVTETLRSLAQPLFHEVTDQPNSGLTARVVFKGGTSLSKAFGLIDRFSEDIDLYVAAKDAADRTAMVGKSRAVTLFKALAERVAADLHIPVDEYADKEKRSDKRAFALAYPQQQAAFPGAEALKPHVLIEFTRMGNPEPNVPQRLTSLLAEFAAHTNLDADFAEFDEVHIDVLAPYRTLVEKLCAMEGCATQGRAEPFTTMARHFYDIYRLLDADFVRDSLAADASGIDGIAADHVKKTKEARRTTGARPDKGFGYSTWIINPDIQVQARATYEQEAGALIYRNPPTFDAILDGVQKYRDLL